MRIAAGVWPEPQLQRLYDRSLVTSPLVARADEKVRLSGMLNETLGFWFAVTTPDAPVINPQIQVTPLTSAHGRIEPAAMRLYRMHWTPATHLAGWHVRSIAPPRRRQEVLDVLVPIDAPLGGLPESLKPGQTCWVWVDLTIPKGTPEGEYKGRITVVVSAGPAATVNIELTVWPLVLPDEAAFPLVAELDHRALIAHHVRTADRPARLTVDDWRRDPRRADIDALLGATLRMLHAHGVTAVLDQLAPVVKVGASNSLVFDWSQYDATVDRIMTGEAFLNRLPPHVWPMPSVARLVPSQANMRESPGSRDTVAQYVRACARHFAEKEWQDRAYLELPDLGPLGGRADAGRQALADPLGHDRPENLSRTARRLAQAITASGAAVDLLARSFPQDMTPYGWTGFEHESLENVVDIWLAPAQFFDPDVMRTERSKGRRTWLSVDRPPFSGSTALSAPPSYVRVLAWQAMALGAGALHLGRINNWPEPHTASDPEACLRWDPDTLLYPGGPFGLQEPVGSVRLKLLRRSMQDAAYVRVLEAHGLGHIARTVVESLAPRAGTLAYRAHFADGRPIGWVDDLEAFEAARQMMAAELMAVAYPERERDRRQRLERIAAWRRLMLECRSVRLFVDGCRVRMGSLSSSWQARVECACSVANGSRVPVDGTVRLDASRFDWLQPEQPERDLSVPPHAWRRAMLTSTMTSLPAQPDGCFDLPVDMAVSGADALRENARVCCIVAAPRVQPVTLDGDLSDWPPGVANVAAGFRWISTSHADPAPSDALRAPAKTLVFVMADDESLYVGAFCQTRAEPATLASRRNTVVYDDFVPAGEELIEILIDPLNAGTRSPADLYHIAVKPTGAALWEKGVSSNPQVGPRESWPADIQVATDSRSDHWTVELKIPLSAFDIDSDQPNMWGFNVTRFDAAGQEFSTWSGASGNAYDPLSLGNLYLPGVAAGPFQD
jgi:hypothetical protein